MSELSHVVVGRNTGVWQKVINNDFFFSRTSLAAYWLPWKKKKKKKYFCMTYSKDMNQKYQVRSYFNERIGYPFSFADKSSQSTMF